MRTGLFILSAITGVVGVNLVTEMRKPNLQGLGVILILIVIAVGLYLTFIPLVTGH